MHSYNSIESRYLPPAHLGLLVIMQMNKMFTKYKNIINIVESSDRIVKYIVWSREGWKWKVSAEWNRS
jgi:hypothetical protein